MRKQLIVVAAGGSLMGIGLYLSAVDSREVACVEPPVPAEPSELYLAGPLRDAGTLGFQILSTDRMTVEGERVVVRRIGYDTIEWRNCKPTKHRAEAFLAMPSSADGTRSRRLPAIVFAHGEDGRNARPSAAGLAARTQAVALAFLADRKGEGDGPRSGDLFRRVTGVVRALTVLADRPEVDASKLAVVGASAGSIVASFDDRVATMVLWFPTGRASVSDTVPTLVIGTATTAFFGEPPVHRWSWSETPTSVPAMLDTTAWWLGAHLRLGGRNIPAPPTTFIRGTELVVDVGEVEVDAVTIFAAGHRRELTRSDGTRWRAADFDAIDDGLLTIVYRLQTRRVSLTWSASFERSGGLSPDAAE